MRGTSGLNAVRSMLFVPGHRPDMVAKTLRHSPDLVVVDLEDAVPASEKEPARRLAVDALDQLAAPSRTTVLVRVNPAGTPWFAEDVTAVAGHADGLVLPKLERLDQLAELRELIEAAGAPSTTPVVGGLETALGVADARVLLGGVAAAYFGAEDLINDIGGRRTAAGHEVLHARSAVVLAARLAGVPAIDQAVLAVGDDEQFLADAGAGRDLGYQGKICIHPLQVELAHRVFTPSAQDVQHARAVLEAGSSGAAVLHGVMIDEVHLRLARATLARAGE